MKTHFVRSLALLLSMLMYGSQLSDCDTMMRAVISGGKNNYTSIYKSFSRVYAKKMADLLSKFA